MGRLLPKASRASQSDRSERGGCDVKNVDPARKIDAERAARVKRACGWYQSVASALSGLLRSRVSLINNDNSDDNVRVIILKELKPIAGEGSIRWIKRYRFRR